MSEFPKLSLRRYAKIQERESNEAKYWKSFVLTKQDKLRGSPNCIHFSPLDPRLYIITYSTSITLYDALNDTVQRSFTRFNDDAFSGKFRQDGKLILAGDKEGYVKVFDVQTKSLLRQLKRHSAAVRSTSWVQDGLHFISGSDDGRIKYWDLAGQEVIWECKQPHTDYVRCVDAHPTSSNLFVSGSYDHSIQVWDNRQEKSILQLYHEQPIVSCLFNPTGSLLYTAGGNEIKVWDILSGGKLIQSFQNHQKNITNLSMDMNGTRLLSCGLDGHLKVYNLQTMKVAHGIRFESPLLSMAISPVNNKLIVGHVDGTILAHTRVLKSNSTATSSITEIEHESTKVSTANRYMTGIHSDGIIVGKVDTQKYTRLRPYEKLLKKFDYQKALDAALKSDNPVIITSLIEELCRRSGLTIALSGRDEIGLQALLSYIVRNINNPKYTNTIIQVMNRIIDLYGGDIGYADSLIEAFKKLQHQIRAEVSFQRQIMRIVGSLDAIVNCSTSSKLPYHDRSTSSVTDI